MMAHAELVIRPFVEDDSADVIALWQRAGLTRPWNDPARDIARKMMVAPELFLVGCAEGTLVASAMGGYDGHRGWVNYLAVDETCRGLGYARRIMDHLEEMLRARGCPKLNLQVRAENGAAVAFYEAAGYAREDMVSMGKRLIADA
ncbi:MAG: GNAT family acetyltransferase [Hyphomicrobiaceae bacterium]